MSESRLEPEQFVVLIARHERRVRAFITTLVAYDADAIDEVLQETYLVAWRKLESFRYVESSADEEAVRWLNSIARLEVLNYLRQRKRQTKLVFDERLVNEIATVQVEDADYFEARRNALVRCVQQLDKRQRESLRLRYGLGLSLAELATRQGRGANAVAAAFARIRKSLERCVRFALRQEGYT